ncbi:MAG: M56 family metallopeptidase [Armatimonadota bacterium]
MLNAVADTWMNAMFRACWQGGIALALVWIIIRLFPKLPPSICCWLWRLAYLKLLVSLIWATPIELSVLPSPPEPIAKEIAMEKGSEVKTPISIPDFYRSPTPTSSQASEESSPKALGQADVTRPNTASVLLLIWFLGLGWQCALVMQAWRRARKLKIASQPVGDARLLLHCSELSRKFGLRRAPYLMSSEEVPSPLLFGIFRPTIIFPLSLLNSCPPEQIRLMLAHELAHLKRKDLIWNWLPTVGQMLFFFHPLLWLAQREWQLAQEMACDEMVILKTNASLSDYGEALLKVSEQCHPTQQRSLVAVGVAESFKNLKRRLIAMKSLKPLSRRKLVAISVAVTIAAFVGIVPWRLVAQPSKPTKRILPQRSETVARTPLRKGMELVYEGEAWVLVSGKETKAKLKVIEFVKEVAPDGTSTVVSLRVFRHPVYSPDASLRTVSVRPDGKEVPLAPNSKQFASEIPPKLFSFHFIRTLPLYFMPPQNLKAGKSWVTEEGVPVYLYVTTVNSQFFPLVEMKMNNQVVGRERINGVSCWVVRRSLVKPVPIHGGDWATHLAEKNETLWVDAKTGLVKQVHTETVLQGRKGKFRHNALKLTLKRQRLLTGSALEQRLKELQIVDMMQRMLGRLIVDLDVYKLWMTLDKDKIDEAQAIVKVLLKNIRFFAHRFPKSPYNDYWSVWGQLLQFKDEDLELTEEFAERIGEPAPDFKLTSPDGEVVQLSALRGKVVLLNFFGFGLREGKITRQRGFEEMVNYVERIHRDYKDKGVVVLGIWFFYPPERLPERLKEFAKVHELTFPILLDDRSVRRAYKISAFPTDIVIDKEGKIRFMMRGYVDKRPLRQAIEAALRE